LCQVLTEREESSPSPSPSPPTSYKAHLFAKLCVMLPKHHWFVR